MRRVLALLVLLSVAPPAGAQVVAEPARATPVDADLGLVVWSAWDGSAFRLTLRDGAGRVRALPIAPSARPFDADVGDDATGRRVVAYTRCASTCDVRLHEVGSGRDTAFGAAARPGVDERAPSISRGQVAWATGGGLESRPSVWIAREAAPPIELPALPRRRCGTDFDGRSRCFAPTGTVGELELRGRTLAQTVTTIAPGVIRQSELRLVDVRARTSAQLEAVGTGEGGQTFIGPSIDGRSVFAYLTCFGDPDGCRGSGGWWRSGLDSRRLEHAASRRQLSGFSVAGVAWLAEGSEDRRCELEQGDYPGAPGLAIGPCPIERSELPERWTAVRR